MEDEIARNDDDLARFPRILVKIIAMIYACQLAIVIAEGIFGFAYGKCPAEGMTMWGAPGCFGPGGANNFLGMEAIGWLIGAFLLWLFSFPLAPSLYKSFIVFAPRHFTEAKAKITTQAVFMSLAISAAVYALTGIVMGIFYYCCLDHRPYPNDLFDPAGNGKLYWVVSVAALAVGILVFYKWANAAVTHIVAIACASQPAPGGAAPAPSGEAAPAGEGGAGEQA